MPAELPPGGLVFREMSADTEKRVREKPTVEQRLHSAADSPAGLTFVKYCDVMTSVLGFDECEGHDGWVEIPQDFSDAVRDELRAHFKDMDEDGSGVVSIDELMHWLAGTEHYEGVRLDRRETKRQTKCLGIRRNSYGIRRNSYDFLGNPRNASAILRNF